jgi:replication initiator protein RepSA
MLTGRRWTPDRYDYRRAARDAIHFPALLDRFWQNIRRCVGWDVQYFGTVEPQKRGAPHFHAAICGAIPHAELRAIAVATYHQVWWPAHDHLVYGGERLPVWDTRAKAFTDPDTRVPLPSWNQACEELTEPAHVVRLGTQVHVKGFLGGTEEAGRHVEHATDRQQDHARRLHATRGYPVFTALRGMAALRHPTHGRPAPHDPRDGARATPTNPSTSASPDAASSCPLSGLTRPWTYCYVIHPPE